jgi:hypothetical protein
MRSVKHQIKLLSSSCCSSCDKLAIEQLKVKISSSWNITEYQDLIVACESADEVKHP